MLHGQGCTKCDQEFQGALPYLLILYYAKENRLQVKMAERKMIGAPLDIYFPEFRSAIIFSRKEHYSKEGVRIESVKDYLCARNRIRLIRILDGAYPKSDRCICIQQKDETEEALETALKEALHMLGIHLDMDLHHDRDLIYGCFRRWKERNLLR